MVSDVAVKNLPVLSGTLPPDAIFTFVHDDVQQRVSFEELQTQVDGGGGGGSVSAEGLGTDVNPGSYIDDILIGNGVDVSGLTAGDTLVVTGTLNPTSLDTGSLIVEGVNEIDGWVEIPLDTPITFTNTPSTFAATFTLPEGVTSVRSTTTFFISEGSPDVNFTVIFLKLTVA